MTNPAAFLSYVREDDVHEKGRITDLRRNLASEVRMQTGHEFAIFQDRDDIFVGQQWRDRIHETIDGSTFLVAVITPAFLRSEACREEVELFLERENALGRRDLIIPIIYVETPGLGETDDDIATELRNRQYFEWLERRFEDRESAAYRRTVSELASQIVAALGRGGTAVPHPSPRPDDGGPGLVELVAGAEDAFPQFTRTLNAFADAVTVIGELTRESGERLDAASRAPKPAAARLSEVHNLTRKLKEPAEMLDSLADDYVDQLARVDGGVTAMIALIPEVESEPDIHAVQTLFASVSELDDAAEQGLGQIQEFSETLTRVGSVSSNLRPVFAQISEASARLEPSRAVFKRWRDDLRTAMDAADVSS